MQFSPLLRLGGFAAVSLLLHGGTVGALLALDLQPWSIAAAAEPVDIEILTTTLPSREPEPTMEEEPPTPAPMPERVSVAPVPHNLPPRPIRDSMVPPTPAVVQLPNVQPEPAPVRPEDREAERRRLAVMLNPANVARSGFTFEGGPTQPGGPAGNARDRGPTEREIEQQHNRELHRVQQERPWLAHTQPQLHRRSDGSYAYTGHRFTAVITREGDIQYQDRGPVGDQGFSAGGTFDITEAMQAGAGQDPHRAEREWFERHTEELRARLEAEARRSENATGLRRLAGALVRVWSGSGSAASRRQRIFAMWDDMADDDAGREGRRIVIDFIRETIPSTGADAYTAQEIARFNAQRDSRAPFDPY